MTKVKNVIDSVGLAAAIWILTSLSFGAGWIIWAIYNQIWGMIPYSVIAIIFAALGSLPVLIILLMAVPWLQKFKISLNAKIARLTLTCFLCTLIYGLLAGALDTSWGYDNNPMAKFTTTSLMATGALFACSALALLLLHKKLRRFFGSNDPAYPSAQTGQLHTQTGQSYTQADHSYTQADNSYTQAEQSYTQTSQLYTQTSQSYAQTSQSHTMETTQQPQITEGSGSGNSSGRIMIKGIITGVLILVMMIPTLFIINLVSEREGRQKEVAAEVSSKWAGSQVLTGPYLYLPYKTTYKDKEGKVRESSDYFWILPEDLQVTGKIDHEIRKRSIYKILLYRANLQDNGHFKIQVPADVDPGAIEWNKARICYSLSDFKGIEERLAIRLKDREYELSPGLPKDDINMAGLLAAGSADADASRRVPPPPVSSQDVTYPSGFSSGIEISAADIGKNIPFDMKLRFKGSGQLHFLPLGGNSTFSLQSGWNSPSFDGNNLPSEREVTAQGFKARWAFNKANLPFGTVLKDLKFDLSSLSFGVTLLQPADQYAQTSRCIKYAILFIGLTFALFFIVELTQKKPMHPVQYVLIGLALVIFYTLLLSISEFILFNYAYLISALATILLITLYAYGHFGSWRSAGLFGGVLTLLYTFIFVLVQLEDTALLVGSIGLFIVLAAVMYVSKRINWYGTTGPGVSV